MIQYLRVPYKPQGNTFNGCDCFGMVQLYYYHEYGVELKAPEYTYDWYKADPKRIMKEYSKHGFKRVKDIRIGDVLVLIDEGYPRHLGVVVSNESFLHTTVRGTACHSYIQGPWSTKIAMILRYKGKRNENKIRA